MTSLGEFESYFRATYIVGQNLVQDLLSRLFDKQKPATYEESIRNITSALNGMKILKTKKLERTITDIQLELIMSKCLLNSDQQEYFREWAREREPVFSAAHSWREKMKKVLWTLTKQSQTRLILELWR